MFGLILFGAISFSRMGVSQLPDVDFPYLNISLTLEGAAPEVMESTVVDFVEDAVMSVEGLKSITSKSRTGSANVTLEFDLNKDIDVALQEVQTKVAQAQRFLPTDLEPPVITKSNPEDQPILWLALTYEKGDLAYMMQYANEQLKDRFTTVPGVGDIFLGGYIAPALRVWVDPGSLRQRNIAVTDIIDAIRTEHSELPGGMIEESKSAYNVRTLGEAKTVEEFRSIPISKRAGAQVADPSNILRMGQVARVEEGLDEIRRLSRFNKMPALGLGVRKQRGANAVAVARDVKARIAEIEKDLPEGMKLHVNFDSTRFIEYSIRELNHHLIYAVILTSLVCWIFLGSWTATLNVLLSIPTSIMGAFIGLYFLGFTLNTFTLLGLTLAIGIVVDDAIMILENIFRYQEQKKGRIEAAIIGTREIAFAAMAATVAVIAIFLPVVFMKGIIGQFFLQFGLTISFAVMLSLLEALTITPMRAASFVATQERTTRIGRGFEMGMHGLQKIYLSTLSGSLRWKWATMLAAVVIMLGSFYLIKFVPKEFSPAQDQSLFLVRMQTPVGSSLAYTDEKVRAAEDWLLSQPEVKQVYVALGGFGGGGGEGNTAIMFVTLVPPDQREPSQQEFMATARQGLAKIEDLTSRLQDPSMRGFGGGRGFPVEFIITGGNWTTLWESTQKIMEEMKASGMMVDIDSDYLLGMPEIQITPDRVKAASHGVSVQAIGNTINSLVGGVRIGQYQKDGRRYDIRLKLDEDKADLRKIGNLLIGNSRSNLIPLSQVVKVETQSSLQQISRVNRQRAITVFANVAPGANQQDALAFVEAKSREVLPDGYRFSSQGSSQTMQESFQSLIVALVLGFAVAYMVLAAQFNSFLDPVTILMALPFAIGGALMALFATFQSLNIYSMIGILLLMGIAKKNSIMLIEFTNQRRRHHERAIDALKEACPIRLRPILMTSMATITAALPSAIATGEGSETFKPMAITIIGGVLLSTLLTLYVVPVVYLLLDRFRNTEDNQREVEEAFRRVGS